MKTIPMPKEFVTCDEKGNPTKVDIEGWMVSLPMKERLAWIIPLMQKIQEEQYKGFKQFIDSTPETLTNVSVRVSKQWGECTMLFIH